MKPRNEFPPGWSEQRVRDLIAHYESQTEEEAAAEDEVAFEHRSTSVVEVGLRVWEDDGGLRQSLSDALDA